MKRILNILLTLACILCLSACGMSAADKWQEQYDLGTKYLSEGNYEEAIIAFTAAIEIDEKKAEAYIGRGDAYLALGGTEENLVNAQADYQKAQELLQLSASSSGTSLDENENGISELYEKLADTWIARDDWISAVAALQTELDIYGRTESLQAKLSELGLKLNYEGTRICPNYDSEQLEEINDAFTHFEFRHAEIGAADNYYLTDAQREDLFRPWIPRFRYFFEYELETYRSTGDFDQWQYCDYLWYLYYWLGYLEEAREVRAQLYESTGWDERNPEDFTVVDEINGHTEEFNGYGAMVSYSNDGLTTYKYDEQGKCIEKTGERNSIYDLTTYIYENGKLVKETYHINDSRGANNIWVDYEYADGRVYRRCYYEDGTLGEHSYWKLDKYGFMTMDQTYWIDVE